AAYILDRKGNFDTLINPEMIEVVDLEDEEDLAAVKELIEQHRQYTDSERAEEVLSDWEATSKLFRKVQPKGNVAVPIETKEEPAKKAVVKS
ncbi:MAG: hypothetical protein AAGH89_14240, partial [Verrucomicrobiota bacterium]